MLKRLNLLQIFTVINFAILPFCNPGDEQMSALCFQVLFLSSLSLINTAMSFQVFCFIRFSSALLFPFSFSQSPFSFNYLYLSRSYPVYGT